MHPAGVFLGKASAIAIELLALEVVLGVGVALLYDVAVHSALLIVASVFTATIGIAAAGTIYGALSAGLKARDTLLPLLALPVLAPVLLAATQACQGALDGSPGDAAPWLRLLLVFALISVTFGVLGFGSLLEEA
jgi:heme exporter protein B